MTNNDDNENNNFGGDSEDDYGFDDDYFGTDPCRCTEDGVSGGVETGQAGCFAISAEIVTSMATNAGRRIGESLSHFFGKDSLLLADSLETAKHRGLNIKYTESYTSKLNTNKLFSKSLSLSLSKC